MTSLQFARIIDPVCSCGTYIGKLQPEIEFRLVEIGKYGQIKTDDTDLAQVLDDLGIVRTCCRGNIIMSPVLRLLKTGETFNIYTASGVKSSRLNRLIIGNSMPRI